MDREDLLELRTIVQRFIRLFGLLEQNKTPCGFELSLSQVFALQELEGKSLTISELAEQLWLERSTVSRLVDSLVKGGFVNRQLNEANRREVLVSLTDKGNQALLTVREQSIQLYQSIMNQVEGKDQAMILEGFKHFTRALSKVRGESNELS